MPKKLTLTDGIEAVFNKDTHIYTTEIKYQGRALEVILVGCPYNPDTREALKYTFDKFYKDIGKYDQSGWDAICEKAIPLLNRYPGKQMKSEDLRSSFELDSVAILDHERIGTFKVQNVRVELSYGMKNPEAGAEVYRFGIGGTLEDGFEELYMNDLRVNAKLFLEPHELSTGDIIEYSDVVEVYTGDVAILDDVVECFFELNDDEASADNAFTLFEKVYKNIYELDQNARALLLSNLKSHLDDMRKALGDEDLTFEEVEEELFFDSAVFGAHGDIEFSYILIGAEKDLKATAMGSYNMGFIKYMIEYLDEGEY